MNKTNWSFPRHIHYERALRDVAAKRFLEKNYPVRQKMKYILASRDDWRKNIILPEVASYIDDQKAKHEQAKLSYPLHRYLHHGLSSQAMLFNLVGPLIVRNDLEPLKSSIVGIGLEWPDGEVKAVFEFENREVFREFQGQPTSIDLVIGENLKKPNFFVESKFVEKEFGGCSLFEKGDCDGRNPASDFAACYLHHIGRQYWVLMKKHGLINGPLAKESTCIMAGYYQFFREVLMTLELGGVFVLLCDSRSPTFVYQDRSSSRGLMPFLLSLIPGHLHSKIKILYIQEVVEAIRESGRHVWIGEFEKKYGLGC
ncbi:MAG: hypothetical protein ISR58_21925 [Anaerolineales bacterium]|nr:hypothetical protein [Anaerolineales bacterium]